jgi:glycosyltransferase involved in cell wall biosynthesis
MASVLFLAPSLLSYRLHKQVRGVDVFDLALIRELVEMGHQVTLPAEMTWRERLNERLKGAMPRTVYTPPLIKPQWTGLYASAVIGRPKGKNGKRGAFDCTIAGNSVRSIVPMIAAMRARGVIRHQVLLAHRSPPPGVGRLFDRWGARIVAVSDKVKKDFPPDVQARVDVSYGVAGASKFFPAAGPRPDRPVRFCVLGALYSPGKGADTALDAFEMLPPEVRDRSELHLAGYPDLTKVPPRAAGMRGVKAYGWRTVDQIAELVREMDVIVQPSLHETFCQSLVQGMLAGLPCLVNDIPVLTEKLDVGGGMAFRSAAELSAQMAQYATDPARRAVDGAIGRRTALARYVWDTRAFADKYLLADAEK